MSLPKDPPVSLKGIQDNFYKSGAVGSVDRYVIDFAQRDGVTWDLLDYSGQSYGLQYDIYADGYGGGPSGGQPPPDKTDRRADGSLTNIGHVGEWGSYARMGEDAQGKYAELHSYQQYPSGPGTIQLNGNWFASEAGASAQYRMTGIVETNSYFDSTGEVGVYVFGYRYGYLDGDRKIYSTWGYQDKPGPNRTLLVDDTFTVDGNYRHIVVNLNAWLPGREFSRAGVKVRNLTIERV